MGAGIKLHTDMNSLEICFLTTHCIVKYVAKERGKLYLKTVNGM